MNKQQLASTIWEAANRMRSKIEANEYKDYILGFIFYKFLSDKEVKFLEGEEMSKDLMQKYLLEANVETEEERKEFQSNVDWIQNTLGYFIPYEHLFSTWLELGSYFDISNVRDGLSSFNRYIDDNYKKLFEGIFDTLETGLSKLGTTSAQQTKAARDLINLIKDIPMDGYQDYDVLGYIYEYLIGNFAANAGKKAGEFYTPHEVSLLMSEIVADHLKDRKSIEIYDSTSGSGSLLINIGKSVAKYMNDRDNIKYYAQELKQNTYNLTRMNLIMRGILPSNIITRNADTLEDDWPYFDENDPIGTYEPLYVDAVVSNPPYSQKWNPDGKDTDPRYSSFGLAPKAKADYAFLLHDLYHLKSDGIMNIVLPHGVLFRGGEEGKIRKNLIEKNHIDAIIGLPANIFFGTGIPTIIMVIKKVRTNNDILIIDASKGFEKEGKNNKLRASDIKRIADTVKYRRDTEKYSRKVSLDEIRDNDYNLNIPRYVDSSESPETYDIYASMFGGIPKNEIDELDKYWQVFPNLKADLFEETSPGHFELKTKDYKELIKNHADIKNYIENYQASFAGLQEKMEDRLIFDMENVNPLQEKNALTDEIFSRMEDIALVDEYMAYQILDDKWSQVAQDMEMIKTEGREIIRQVGPNFVIKKRKDKDVEVQEGWVGKIIPFELVEASLLKDQKEQLDAKENLLDQVISDQEEIFESFSEEDKEDLGEDLNNDNTAFTAGGLTRLAKEFLADGDLTTYDEESLEYKVIRTKDLSDQEKILKKEIKEDKDKLHALAKTTIENLDQDQVNELLKDKWTQPIMEGILDLPKDMVSGFADKVKALGEKYDTTLIDLENQIQETEKELIGYLDQLTGSEMDMKGIEELKKLLGGF